MKLTEEKIMKILLFLICLLSPFISHAELESIYDSENWIELSKIYVTKNSPSHDSPKYLVMWMNTYSQTIYPVAINYPFPGDWSGQDRWMERYGWAGKSYPDNEWVTVSVADRVPENAKAIFLTGRLIVSNGHIAQTGNMTVTFRRKGETREFAYQHQACICNVPECARSCLAVWVPLNEDKEFEFKWTRSTFGQWPEHPAYGMSLSLNAWGE